MRVLTALAVLLPLGLPLTDASAGPDPACSWAAKSEPDTVNVAYPDTNASYWSHSYSAAPGTELRITGTYAKARYFSFHAYQPTGVPLDSIYDAQIRPDRGSSNPFAGGPLDAPNQRYTLTVSFTAKPAKPRPNTIYAGELAGGNGRNPGGILMLRVYTPKDARSPQGSVPLPTVTWRTTAGQDLSVGTACSNDLPAAGGSGTSALNGASQPDPAPQTTGTEPSWGKAFGNNAAGFFGNQQNAYLTAGINRANGPLVVIRARAPRFPDTSRGQQPGPSDQVRYWSICQNSNSTRVNACVADYQAAVDKRGYFTFVVSDPAQRPVNATARNGVTWLPWGAADSTGLLIYRNMAPAASFRQAVQVITKADDPAKVMGAYYPLARYCTKQSFEQHTWRCSG
ncbi:MAG: hypothetical protein QOE99_563 [Actinomycetota bacterium]|nr:hypothetical protein [Actinomycetota bacterium]